MGSTKSPRIVAILTRFEAGEKRVLIQLKMGYVPKLGKPLFEGLIQRSPSARQVSRMVFRKALRPPQFEEDEKESRQVPCVNGGRKIHRRVG